MHFRLVRPAVFLFALLFSAAAVAAPRPPKKLDTSEKNAQVFRFKHKAGKKLRFTNSVIQELGLEVIGGDLPIPNEDQQKSTPAQ